MRLVRLVHGIGLASLLAVSCQSTPPEPVSTGDTPPPPPSPPKQAATASTAKEAVPAASAGAALAPGGDPKHGSFTLEEATQGLSGKGPLMATLKTDLGTLECELYEDKAPLTVANFVGLARGLRPYRAPTGEWVKNLAYNGTKFHRVIKGFMIQGGDPLGTGGGEPGYVIPDEIWSGAKHDRRGLMCMANRGPNTNGMQFFITDAAAPHLDRSYTIFGSCTPDDVIAKLASVEVKGERPVKPPVIESVTIQRGPAAKAKRPAPKVSSSASP